MEIENRLKDIKIENFIFIIYIGIILLSFYSNSLEKKYFLYNDQESKEKYRYTLIIIFSIALIVYIYYAYNNYKDLQEANQSNETRFYNNLSMLASSLVLISGIIYLYIAYKDKDVNIELAFN